MRDIFPGMPDDALPRAAKIKFFCQYHQLTLGVICEKKLNCDKCGWNPAVAKRRKKLIEERMMQK